MSNPQKQYTRELFDKFSYIATWLPGVPVSLGDIGVIRDGHFQRVSSLANLGIEFTVRPDDTSGHLDYASQGAVSISFKAAGEVPPAGSLLARASAGVLIQMKRENAVLFQVDGARSPSIDDQLTLEQEIRRRHADGRWDPHHFVITEVLDVTSASILIASSGDARIELSARGHVSPANFRIADLDVGFEVASVRGMHTQIISSEGLTPLFRARRLKPRLFRSPIFRNSAPSSGGPDDLDFAGLTPDDL